MSLSARFDPSNLLRPKSIEEALLELKKQAGRARIVGGNTTLYELARQGALADVETLIDLGSLGLDYVKYSDRQFVIGCSTTLAEIAGSNTIRNSPCAFALSECAGKITPPQVRNMATIGGAICSAIPFYDMPTVLYSLDAKVRVLSLDRGTRELDMDSFFVDYFVTSLAPDEMVVEIIVPNFSNNFSAFRKLGRTSADFAVVNAAARLGYDEETNRIVSARISLGAITSTPIRAKESEELLIGSAPNEKLIQEASRIALNGTEPTPSIHASSEYKKKIAAVLVRDVITSALDKAGVSIPKSRSEK